MKAHKEDSNVCILMSQDESIVLLEWVSKFNEREDIQFVHQSEERLLWDIESALEKISTTTFEKDFNTLVSNARERIKDQEE